MTSITAPRARRGWIPRNRGRRKWSQLRGALGFNAVHRTVYSPKPRRIEG